MLTMEEIEAIKKLHSEGYFDNKIAQKLNRHPETIRKYRRKMGLPNNFTANIKENMHKILRNRHLRTQKKIITEYNKNNWETWEELSERLNMKPQKIKEIVGRHLTEKCRADEKSPFKPLLPEYKQP